MKKNIIFSCLLVVIGALLCSFKQTKLTAHIVIAIVGVITLIVYTVLTKKEWKIPVLEIIMRVFYLLALITGIVTLNVEGIQAFAIIHKISAVLFILFVIGLFVHKLLGKKAE